MSLNFIFLFSATVFIASIIPGPSMLLALTHGMYYGARRTIASAMGNITVTFMQAFISIAGLGSILMASEAVFQLIKWLGAAYLVYMGISILCSHKFLLSPDQSLHFDKKASCKKRYMQAVIITAGNPKAILFFTAVFPQFIDTKTAYLSQICVLMSICLFIAFFCFMIYAVCGQKIVTLFSGAAFVKYIKRIIGVTFIGAGISLAVKSRQ